MSSRDGYLEYLRNTAERHAEIERVFGMSNVPVMTRAQFRKWREANTWEVPPTDTTDARGTDSTWGQDGGPDVS